MNWDYVAGFFDGEGNINILKRGGGRRPRARITIVQRIDNSDILENIKDFLIDVGIKSNIYKRKPYQDRLPVSALQIDEQRSVYNFLFYIGHRILKDRKKLKDAYSISEHFSTYRTKLTDKELTEAKRLRERGFSFKNIGKRLNRDDSNLSKRLRLNV